MDPLLFKFLGFVILLVSLVRVNGLVTESAQECGCLPNVNPDPNFNITWFRSTPNPMYFVAGSKYNMYQLVSGHPNYDQMRESQFYYDACVTSSSDFHRGFAFIHGFGGRVLGQLRFRPYTQQGILDMDFTPVPLRPELQTLLIHHRVTLTDNESFVFFTNCFDPINRRGWSVISTKPTLDEKTKELIQKHAESLGFEKNKMIFFRRETCWNHGYPPVAHQSVPWGRFGGAWWGRGPAFRG